MMKPHPNRSNISEKKSANKFAIATVSGSLAILLAIAIFVKSSPPHRLAGAWQTSKTQYDPVQMPGTTAERMVNHEGETPVLQRGIGDETAQKYWTVTMATQVAGVALPDLQAAPGELVSLTLANASPVETQSFHNLVITRKDRVNAVAQAAVQAGEPSHWIPSTPDVLAATGLVAPGSAQTIVFRAPSEAGEYRYFCTFPGHAAGEVGSFWVK